MCDCFALALRCWVSLSHWSSSACVQLRWGSSSRSIRLTCGRVIWGIFSPPLLLHTQQERPSQHRQRHVVVPPPEATHLIFIQSRLSFGYLELSFDGPPSSPNLSHHEQRRLGLGGCGRIRQVVARPLAIQVTPQQQPARPSGQAISALPHATRRATNW